MVEMSIPSMRILPDVGSVKRRMLIANVLFPDPVRPSKPTLSPARKEKLMSFRTDGRSGAYLIIRFSTEIMFSEREGQ